MDGVVNGKIVFFSTGLSEPADFETVDDLIAIKPKGRGGTDFNVVFDYLSKYKEEHEVDYYFGSESKMPGVVIIITDGYAPLIDAEQLEDIGLSDLPSKLVWLLLETNIRSQTWGKSIWVNTNYND